MRPVVLAPLLLVATLLAQSGEGRVRAKFRALSFDGPILGAGYLEGKEVRPLDISADCFTAEQSYVGPNPLHLVLLEEANLAPAPPAAPDAHQAKIQALAQELADTQRRLSALTAQNRERGGKAPPATAEVGLLKAQMDKLNREMAELTQSPPRLPEPLPPVVTAKSHPTPKVKSAAGVANPPAATPGPAPKNERPSHRPLADFVFPASGRYLLLVHRTANATTINAIDDQEGTFPYGSMQFINLTGGDVEVRFGGRTLALSAKGKGILKPGGGHNTYAEGEIHTKAADGFHLGYSMRIFVQEDVRTLYFLLPVEDGGHGVRLKGIEERRPPEPAPGATTTAAPPAPGR